MLKNSIGNDIVDLETKEPPLHPRYLSRVFTTEELEAIGTQTSILWAHWAAKEACFKMVRRHNSSVIFSPHEFRVELNESAVVFRGEPFPLKIEQSKGYVSALCASQKELLHSPSLYHSHAAISSNETTPSHEVRQLASNLVGRQLKISPALVTFSAPTTKGVPPCMYIQGECSESLVSFSHHGNRVACAVLLLP